MKPDQRLEQLVDQVCENCVLLEATDLQALAILKKQIEAIGSLLRAQAENLAAEAAAAVSGLLKGVLFEEDKDPDATLDIVARAVAAFQSMIRHGIEASAALFPPELGLEGPPASPSAGGRAAASATTGGLKPPLASAEEPSPASAELPPATTDGRGVDEVRLPPGIDTEILEMFLDQEDTVLTEMDDKILAFEKTRAAEHLAALRRLLHTLKGEAGVLGLDAIAQVCHQTEDYLEADVAAISADRLFAVKDWFSRTFAYLKGQGGKPQSPSTFVGHLFPATPKAAAVAVETPAADTTGPESDRSLLEEFVSDAAEHIELADQNLLVLERSPDDEEALNAVFRCFHTLKGVSSFLDIPDITHLAHASESLLDAARKGRIRLSEGAVDVVFKALDKMKKLVGDVRTALGEDTPVKADPDLPALLDQIAAVQEGRPGRADTRQRPIESRPAPPARRPASPTDTLAPKADPGGEVAPLAQAVRIQEHVKIDVDRLDLLIDTIGELVIAQSIVAQDPDVKAKKGRRLRRSLLHLGKTVRRLQEMSMSMRMSAIRPLFHKMARMVRDLAKRANKPIEFSMHGEDTELDRGMLEQIGDPLVHMIRNAVDHGIEESSEARRQAGKPAMGHIELRAFHKGGNIHVSIRDDGRGLNREAILAKGLERGLIQSAEGISDQELFSLIFTPGFSTAARITDISGRGVGMDVVLRNIEALHGQVLIDSQPGKGTTFTLVFPLTLAIIDGMIVRIGSEIYVVPVLSIVESFRPAQERLMSVAGRGEMVSARGTLIPVFRLADLLGIPGARRDPTQAILVVVEDAGRNVALMVDALLEEQQVVIKSLGEGLGGISGISGSCIMPDGRVALILDIGGIIRLATATETIHVGAAAAL